jgi:hypothetical protein
VLFFEVLLDVRGLVFDMQARLHAIGDHAGPIAKGRWGRGAGEAQRKQQPHAVGPSQIEVLADDGFEEMTPLHRTVKHLREADLELTDGEAMVVSRGAFVGGHWPRQAMRPAIEEGLDVGRPERITGRL